MVQGKTSIEEDTCRGDGYELNTESDRYLIQDLFPRLLGRALAAAGLGGEPGCCQRRMRVRGAQIRASCRWCLAKRCVSLAVFSKKHSATAVAAVLLFKRVCAL
jgi:hypothetical protein